MDADKFRASRKAQLDEFTKEYNTLKQEYSATLLSAIQEQDPKQQQSLVSKVLAINAEIADKVRSMLSEVTKAGDKTSIDDLSKKLVHYQKQYDEIEKGKSSVSTLKLIYQDDQTKLADAQKMYTFYVVALVVLAFLLVFMIVRSGFVTTIGQMITQTVASVTPQSVY